MTFLHPTWLIGLLAAGAWAAYEWRRSGALGRVLLKAAAAAAIFVSLAEPTLRVSETRRAVVVLADQSASVAVTDGAAVSSAVAAIRDNRGPHAVRVLGFGADPQPGLDDPSESQSSATDLEAALSAGLLTLREKRAPRIVLVSDGQETSGFVARSLALARERRVPIDVIPLSGRASSSLRLSATAVPARAYRGEAIPIELTIDATTAGPAELRLSAENRELGRQPVTLAAGQNTVIAEARINSEGSVVLSGDLDGGPLGSVSFRRAIQVAQPKLLLASAEAAHLERNLAGVLATASFDVTRAAERWPPDLAGFDILVANNRDFERWPQRRKDAVADFVSNGGGFLIIGGEQNVYLELPENQNDEFHRMLPGKLAPPRTPEGTAVVLVMDKSSSMEGKKMQLARQSGIGLVDNLREFDKVGVLVFDNSHQWAVPLRENDAPGVTKRLIAGVVADGGTQIAPALHEAYRRIRGVEAVYRHILLLTDGISEEGDSIALAREAARRNITISTVGLGQDVNRSYLDRVAAAADGKSYFLLDISKLEQLVLDDVMEHTGTSIMEEAQQVSVIEQAEIIEGLDFRRAGDLRGWVRFEAKSTADEILRIKDEDPLLLRWQYGLGRSAIFASDAKAVWAQEWVQWDGFQRFWTNVLRDLLPRTPSIQVTTEWDAAASELVLRYDVHESRRGAIPRDLPRILTVGPEGFRAVTALTETESGAYEARIPGATTYGLYRHRAEDHLDVFAETAFLRDTDELTRTGQDERLLRTLAAETGGRYNPPPAEIFNSPEPIRRRDYPLWPLLLGIAILATLAELLWRKGWLNRLIPN